MFLVGLTGGIATGKSTVSNILRELGIDIVDGDVVAREVVKPGKPAWKKIKKEFGDQVFLPDGTLNRALMGEMIFSNPELRKKLNAITHPEIYKSMFWTCFKSLLQGKQFVILDLPLLFESGQMTKYIHKVIVVSCNESQQLSRLTKRNKLSEEDALKRIDAQMPLREKCKLADFVIDNSGSLEETRAQVETVGQKLKTFHINWALKYFTYGVIAAVGASIGYGIYVGVCSF